MKLVITGATGFVGGEVVRQCIANPALDSIMAVSRREPAKEVVGSSKVRLVLHPNFSEWPASLLDQLEGAEGCIWTVGGKVQDFPNYETARKASVDYTLGAARAFAATLALPLGNAGRKFSFVFCSRQGAKQQQDARVWLFFRHAKAQVEKGLFDITAANPSFATFIRRPGGVLPDHSRMTYAIAGPVIPVVHVSDLASVLISTCLTQPASKVIEDKEIAKARKKESLMGSQIYFHIQCCPAEEIE